MKVMSCDKIVLLLCVSTCRTTSFERLQQIHLKYGATDARSVKFDDDCDVIFMFKM